MTPARGAVKIVSTYDYVVYSTMVNITISLPEQTVRRLRRTVRETYGGRKGALSGFIKEAIDEHLIAPDGPPSHLQGDREREGNRRREQPGGVGLKPQRASCRPEVSTDSLLSQDQSRR